MTYEEAISFLRRLGKFGTNLGLERITRLLRWAGDPHLRFRVIHVAGTVGKGSVAAMTESIMRAAGYRVGLYTSPHLSSHTERIKVNGRDIPRPRLAELVERLAPAFEDVAADPSCGPPTEFEMGTAVAFLHFAEELVDYAVVEVGLGGRLDATNVVVPLVSVITTVGMDHTEHLGRTLGEIAFEKAGIIKPGAPVVVGRQQEEALRAIRRVAEERRAPLAVLGDEIVSERTGRGRDHQLIRVAALGTTYEDLRIPLLGTHQVENAAVAVGAAETARRLGAEVRPEAVRAGLARVRWPGRLEVLQRNPLVLVDGAHNPDGVRALADAVPEIVEGEGVQDVTAVVGISKDKPARELVREVARFASFVIGTRASSSRLGGTPPDAIASYAESEGRAATFEADAKRACDLGLVRAGERGALVVCGSLYLVGEVRGHLLSTAGRLPHTRRIVIFSGAYGSGKTEASLNFALLQRSLGKRVLVLDLDIVNPYFRSREAARAMAERGIEVVSATQGFEAADLPAPSPRILQAFHDDGLTVVCDAGGDPAGARILAAHARHFEAAGYDMYFVLNTARPFTRDCAAAQAMLESIEETADLSFTGIVSNTHLGDETSPEDVREGLRVSMDLARARNIPVVFACVRQGLAGSLAGTPLGTRLVELELFMQPSWRAPERASSDAQKESDRQKK